MIRLYLEVDFGEYKYYDMDKVIERALEVCKKILDQKGEKVKRILTYGTFDLLHFGHIEILRRAKALR